MGLGPQRSRCAVVIAVLSRRKRVPVKFDGLPDLDGAISGHIEVRKVHPNIAGYVSRRQDAPTFLVEELFDLSNRHDPDATARVSH